MNLLRPKTLTPSFSRNYEGYTRGFGYDNPYLNKSSYEVSSDVTDLLANAYKRKYAHDPYEERTGLNRAFDALLTPNYMVAGFVKGLADNGQDGAITPWQGAWRGLKAGIPIGDGYSQGRYSFSQVLETAGWHPSNTFGKIAKGTLGFVLDVALDPTTYLSGGVSALIKGTGKAGLKAFGEVTAKALAEKHGIADIGNIADLPAKIREANLAKYTDLGYSTHQSNFLSNLAYDDAMSKLAPTLGGMNLDMAKDVIKSRQFSRGERIADDQLAKDAESLMKRYNSIVGLRDSGKFEMKLSNAPFGDKLFKWTGIADKPLFSLDTLALQKLSDKLKISSAYSSIRKNIYGTQFGKLFSNNAKLYQLSKADPGAMYDWLSAVEKFDGLKLDKLEKERLIRGEADKMKLDLDPSDMKALLKLMQNKKDWNWITKKIKFSDTREGMNIKKIIDSKKVVVESELKDITKMRDEVEALIENDKRAVQANEKGIETARVAVDGYLNAYKKKIRNLRRALLFNRDWSAKSKNYWLNQLDELDSYTMVADYRTTVGKHDNERLIKEYRDAKQVYNNHQSQINDRRSRIVGKIHKGDILTGDQHAENHKLDALNTILRREIRQLEGQGVSFIPQKEALVQQLGKYFFNDEHYISRSAPDAEIEHILRMMRTYSDEDIIKHIKQNINTLSGRTLKINQFIGSLIGYGKDLKFENWFQYYTDRMRPIKVKEDAYQKLRNQYVDEITTLEKAKKKVLSGADIVRLKQKYPWLKHIDGNERLEKFNKRSLEENKHIDERLAHLRSELQTSSELKRLSLTPSERKLKDQLEMEKFKRDELRNTFKLAKTDEEVNQLMADMLDKQNMDEFYANPDKFHTERFTRGRTLEERWRDEQLNNQHAQSTRNVQKKSDETYGDGVSKTTPYEVDSWDKTIKNPYDNLEFNYKFTPEEELTVLQDLRGALRDGDIKLDRASIAEMRMIAKEMPDILEKTFAMGYDKLSQGQKVLLFKRATQNYSMRMRGQNVTGYSGELAIRITKALRLKESISKIKSIESRVKVGTFVSWIDKEIVTPGVAKKDAVHVDDYKPARILEATKDPNTKRISYWIELTDGRKVHVDGRDIRTGNGNVNKGAKVEWNERRLKSPAVDEVKEVSNEKWINGRVSEVRKDQHGGTEYVVIDHNQNTMTIRPYNLIRGRVSNYEGIEKTADELLQSEKLVDSKNMGLIEDIAHEENYIRDALKRADEYGDNAYTKFADDKKILLNDYLSRRDNINVAIKDMEDTINDLNKKVYENIDYAKIDEITSKLEKMNRVLNDDDALESYIRGLPHFGDKYVDDSMNKFTLDFLDANKEYNQRVIDTAKFLKEKFADMASKEVKMGKLLQVQVDKMVDRYIPHMLTDAGNDFFKVYDFAEDGSGNLIAVEKTLEKDSTFLTQDLGYGRVWNPNGMNRTFRIKTDKLDSKGKPIWIKNPTIEQINEYIQKFPDIVKKLKGNPLYSDDVAEIYLQRGLRHLELFYDNRYMETMIHNFGFVIKNFDDLDKGYKAVVNVTKMKSTIGELAHKRLVKELSEEASLERSEAYKAIGKRANTQAWEEIKSIGRREIRDKYKAIEDRASDMAKEELSRRAKDYLREQRQRGIKGKIDLPKLQREIYSELLAKYKEEILSVEGRPTFTALSDVEKDKIYQEKFADIIKNEGEPQLTPKSPEEFKGRFEGHYKQVTSDLKFTPSMLNEAATPMLELQKHQFDAIKQFVPEDIVGNFGIVRAVNESIVQRANQAKQIQIARDTYKWLKVWDKFTHWFKLNQTTVLPSFHLRNEMSNTFQTWLAVGNDAFNIKMRVESLQTVRSEGKAGKGTFKRLEKDGTFTEMTWNEAHEKAIAYGVVDKGLFAVDIGAQDATEGFLKFLPGKYDITDTKNFKLYKGFDGQYTKYLPVGADFGNMIENSARLLQYVSHLKMGKSFDEARDLVNKFLFDYSDITAFEANVMKRIIPFYVWMRKNAKLQLEQMIEQPGKYQLMAKYTQGLNGMNNQEDRVNTTLLNEFAKDWIQLPFKVKNEQGRMEPIMLNPAMPYMDLSRIPNPLKPIKSFRNLVTNMNPQLKIPFEQGMNKQYFFEQPIVQGQQGAEPTTQDQITGRLDHALSHMSLYNAGKDLVRKSGLDWGLEAFATLSGIKAVSYDYDKFKFQMMERNLNRPKEIGEIGYDAVVSGFGNAYHFVTDAVGDTLDKINSGRPMEAGSYTGALAPISKMAYNKLSKEEKLKYVPPTNGEVLAFNAEAKRLEDEALAKTGKAKKFVWTLLDSVGLGEERGFTIGHVIHVADGDTFTVMVGDKKKTIRMLLVDTPETVKPATPEMPFGKDASNHSKKTLINKDVRLVFEPRADKEDKYGRILAYVELDGVDYGKNLIEEGYGKYSYDYNSYARADEYKAAERKAYDNNKGIWQLDAYAELNKGTPYYLNYNLQQKYKELLKSMKK